MQVPERFYVYEHLRRCDGSVFYVGKGSGSRAYQGCEARRSAWWTRIAKKSDGFDVRLVASNLCEELAFLVEIEEIDLLRRSGANLCNLTSGGEGASGTKRSEEWRQKMSQMHSGKVISAETRALISQSVRARNFQPNAEQRLKMSLAHKGQKRSLGYKFSPEQLERHRASHIGIKSRTGQKRSAEERAKVSLAMKGRPQPIHVCPECGKTGGNAMLRWHFDNCKEKAK